MVVESQRRQVTVYTSEPVARIDRDGDTLTGGDVIPRFELAVTDNFDGPLSTA